MKTVQAKKQASILVSREVKLSEILNTGKIKFIHSHCGWWLVRLNSGQDTNTRFFIRITL